VVAGFRPDMPMVREEPRHPAVQVYAVAPATGAWVLVGEYDAPFAEGDLTIIGASGATLQLEWCGGRMIGFDVVTHRFSGS
jgi:hypothetical protein